MDFAWPSNVDIYKQSLLVNNSLHDYIPSKAFLIAVVSTTIFGADDGAVCAINRAPIVCPSEMHSDLFRRYIDSVHSVGLMHCLVEW